MDASLRYALLVVTAAAAVPEEPGRPGVKRIDAVPDVRAYALELSRTMVPPAERVGAPRHVLIYRIAGDGVIEILGLIHDRMLLSRAARKAIRDAKLSS